MIIQILLLTMGLDMSRPEFEPTTDISGNYIMGSYDVSSDDFVVEELEDVPVDATPSVDDSLSTSPVRGEKTLLRSSNTVILEVSTITNRTLNTNVDPFVLQSGNYTYKYVSLTSGIEYTFISDAPRIFYSSSLDVGSDVYVIPSSTWIPDADYFAFVLSTRSLEVSYVETVPDDPSGNDPSGGSFDDTNIVNALVDVNDTLLLVYARLRAIGLYVLFAFAYPIALAIVKNIVGGDK